jgi:6-phosphogluconolactonase/glucosamine-6-phosphate isomerase/deaminase
MKRIQVDNPQAFAHMVTAHIQQVAEGNDREILIGIPGGRGAVAVVAGVLECQDALLKRIQLFLVDERLEGPTNLETLLDVGLSDAIGTGRLRSSQIQVLALNKPFNSTGRPLDLVYLGVGEDGHVASLFPGSYPALDAKDISDTALVEDSPKPPPTRVTITYRGLKTYAKRAQVYLLFFGEGKRLALDRFLSGNESPSTLPCIYFPREWFSVDIVTDLKEAVG